jgi:alkylhydroperoxidase family enzyme
MDIGSAVGRATGVTDAQLRELADYRASTAFSALDCLVLDYAVAMTDVPVEVNDDVFRALRSHFDDAQMLELTATIAWENYCARFDHALGIESPGFSAGASCVLPERSKPDRVPPRS